MESDSLRAASERLDQVLRELDHCDDPDVQQRLSEAMSLLMDLYGTGLQRVLDLAADPALGGAALLNRIADDSVLGPLLIIHGKHPYGIDVRMSRMLDRLRPRVAVHGCRVTVAGVEGSTVRIRIDGEERIADRTALRQLVETALSEAAPEIEEIVYDPPLPSSVAPHPSSGAPSLIPIMRASGELISLRRPDPAPVATHADTGEVA